MTITMNIDDDFNNNISKYYWKIVIAAHGVIFYPRVRKVFIKLRQIICKYN